MKNNKDFTLKQVSNYNYESFITFIVTSQLVVNKINTNDEDMLILFLY